MLRAQLAVMQLASAAPDANVHFACADVSSAYWASVLPVFLKFGLLIDNEVVNLVTNRMLFGHHWGPFCVHGFLGELAAPRGFTRGDLVFMQIIDDLLWFGFRKLHVATAAQSGCSRVVEKGYSLSEAKSHLIPRLHVPFLGCHVSRLGITVDVQAWFQVVCKCMELLHTHGVLGFRDFMRLCGWILHVTLNPLVRFKLGILYIKYAQVGVLMVTPTVVMHVQKMLALALVPAGPAPVPLPPCPIPMGCGRPGVIMFVDAAVDHQLGGMVAFVVSTKQVLVACQYDVPAYACDSQQSAELYAMYKALWLARLWHMLDDLAVVTDNSAVWWQLVKPRVSVGSAVRYKLLSKIFKLPFHTPLCVGWVRSGLNPADVLSRERFGLQHTQWGYVEVAPVPEDVMCRAQEIQSPWMGVEVHPTKWTCQPPSTDEEQDTPCMLDASFHRAWKNEAMQCACFQEVEHHGAPQ